MNSIQSEKSGGLILLACSIFSLLLANTFGETYLNIWHTDVFNRTVVYLKTLQKNI